MISFLANPDRFMAIAKPLRPYIGALGAILLIVGLYYSFSSPEDYQQGDTVRIMYVHVPSAWMGLLIYLMMGVLSFFGIIFRHAFADAMALALAPIGAVFTGLALITGGLWGQPMWGTWWQWDGRMTSVLVLFLCYIGFLLIHAVIEDEARATKSAGILAMVGLINLPIIKFSVEWWNSLHQGASVLRADGPSMTSDMLIPLLIMTAACHALMIWIMLIRLESSLIARKLKRHKLRASLMERS